jgi:hypothetical protein
VIQLLLIGRASNEWAIRIRRDGPAGLKTIAERLPTAAIRRIDALAPDAVVVIDSGSFGATSTVVDVIRKRSIGLLTPIFVISSTEGSGGLEDGVAGHLPLTATVDELVQAILAQLELDVADLSSESDPGTYASTEDSEPSHTYVPSIQRRATVNSVVIKEMLRSVRHEDYFAILGVSRTVDTEFVNEAFYREYHRFDPAEIDFSVAQTHYHELLEIRDAIEDAWAVLGSEALRDAYMKRRPRK